MVLMGYTNPIEAMEWPFVKAAAEASRQRPGGGLPARRGAGVLPRPADGALDPVFLLAPTSTEQRFGTSPRWVAEYIYCVSWKG